MNKVDIVRKYIGNDDFYDMNGTPLLTKILAAMDEYAQQQVKNCSMPDIVLRSEQYCDNADRHNRHILNDGFAYCPECGKEI